MKPPIQLFEVYTRAYLHDLSAGLGKRATLEDIPDSFLRDLAGKGFSWVWWMGIWQTGEAGKKVSGTFPQWQEEFRKALPDLTEQDITGSCFAVTGYKVHKDFGGNSALEALRQRMKKFGLKLMLDFIPNHTAIDHPWVKKHIDYYIHGTAEELNRQPDNYQEVTTAQGPIILAHGRDPNFPGWPDTLQLDFSKVSVHNTVSDELVKVSGMCDGVRCDMAMLLLPDVFMRTWKRYMLEFWPEAIARVKAKFPGFLFLAEVYWDLEWELMQQGFDYCYDKRLYDRLLFGQARTIKDHLRANLTFQEKLMRFLENHDETRAAVSLGVHQQMAAAAVTYFLPGMRFFHAGQEKGLRTRIPVHLARGPAEQALPGLEQFYGQLFKVLQLELFRHGDWLLLDCRPAWADDQGHEHFLVYLWSSNVTREKILVAVNYSGERQKCYVRLPYVELAGKNWTLEDLMGDQAYERDGSQLVSEGLYLDMPEWGYHVFRFQPVRS